MTAAGVIRRTSTEVAGIRAEAEWQRDLAEMAEDRYTQVTMQAVIDTVDWVDGIAPAPLSGDELDPDAYGLDREETRAGDQERAATSREARWRAGRVATTLAWLAGDPVADSPV